MLLELCIDMTLKLVVDETPTDGEQHLFKECHVVIDTRVFWQDVCFLDRCRECQGALHVLCRPPSFS